MMKKKFKDLTFKEVNNICSKHECTNCPLNDLYYCFLLGVENKGLSGKYLNKEVEVEENEN